MQWPYAPTPNHAAAYDSPPALWVRRLQAISPKVLVTIASSERHVMHIFDPTQARSTSPSLWMPGMQPNVIFLVKQGSGVAPSPRITTVVFPSMWLVKGFAVNLSKMRWVFFFVFGRFACLVFCFVQFSYSCWPAGTGGAFAALPNSSPAFPGQPFWLLFSFFFDTRGHWGRFFSYAERQPVLGPWLHHFPPVLFFVYLLCTAGPPHAISFLLLTPKPTTMPSTHR